MSTATETTSEMRDLARALVEARDELAAATAAAKGYEDAMRGADAEIQSSLTALRAEAEVSMLAAKSKESLASAALKEATAIDTSAAAASKLGEKLSKLNELTLRAGLGGEAAEKFNHIKKSFDLAGDASLTMGQRARAGAAGVKMMGGIALGVASEVVQFARDVTQASARVHEYDMRVRALGAAHQAIRDATAGSVDATVAFTLKQGLADRGIEQSVQNLTVLTRAVREHANRRGISMQEASQEVQQALDGDAAAAARFGVRLAGVTGVVQQQNAVLGQLAAGQRGVAVESQNAAEVSRSQEAALGRVGDAYKNMFGRVITSLPHVRALSAAVDHFSGSTNASTAAEVRNEAAMRETTRQNKERVLATQHASSEATRALREQHMALAAQFVDARDGAGVTNQLAEAQREYAAALRRTRDAGQTAGLHGDDLERRRIALLQDEIGKRERLNQLRGQADASRSAERELGHLAAQARARGMVVGLEVQSVPTRQRLNELLAEAANLTRREGETAQEFASRATSTLQAATAARQEAATSGRQQAEAAEQLRRATQDLAMEQRRAFANEVQMVRIQPERFESQLDFTRRAIELQRQLNDEVIEGREADELAAAESAVALRLRANEMRRAEEDQRRAAEVGARDRALIKAAERRQEAEDFRQRSSLDVQLREQYGLSATQLQTDSQRNAEHIKMLTGSVSELGSGAAQALLAAANSGEDAGAALAKYVDEWAGAKAIQWGMQSLEAFASAGLAYFIRPDAVPGLVASGIQFAGLAAGAGIATAAIPNAPSGGAGGPAGGGSGTPKGERLASTGGSSPGAQGGQATYVININSLTAAGPETSAAISRAIDQGTRYGVSPRPTRPIPRSI